MPTCDQHPRHDGHTHFPLSGARPERRLQLAEGVQLVAYRNGHERVFYQNEGCHTFSLYLEGGFQTYRTDAQGPHGAPGHFCLMPQGSYSAWDVGGDQRFVHLYFDDAYLKRLALTTLDLDPRRVSLPQLTFSQDPGLEALLRHGVMAWDWEGGGANLAMAQAVNTLLVNLVARFGVGKTPAPLTGGLAPAVRQRVLEYIHAHFRRPLTLAELAAVAGLSEYHFCRMFRLSLAETPQQYVTRLRVEQARRLIERSARGPAPGPTLAEIALDCGFANQSHLGRVFRQYTGMSPGRYRRGC